MQRAPRGLRWNPESRALVWNLRHGSQCHKHELTFFSISSWSLNRHHCQVSVWQEIIWMHDIVNFTVGLNGTCKWDAKIISVSSEQDHATWVFSHEDTHESTRFSCAFLHATWLAEEITIKHAINYQSARKGCTFLCDLVKTCCVFCHVSADTHFSFLGNCKRALHFCKNSVAGTHMVF